MEKLKVIIALAVVAAAIYVGWNLIPPYFNNYQFQDDLDDVARRTSYLNKSEDEIRDAVIKKAAGDNVTLKEEQVMITRQGGEVGITVKYRVHVELMVRPVDLDFTVNSYNKRI
jgi:hypothetical protein